MEGEKVEVRKVEVGKWTWEGGKNLAERSGNIETIAMDGALNKHGTSDGLQYQSQWGKHQ